MMNRWSFWYLFYAAFGLTWWIFASLVIPPEDDQFGHGLRKLILLLSVIGWMLAATCMGIVLQKNIPGLSRDRKKGEAADD